MNPTRIRTVTRRLAAAAAPPARGGSPAADPELVARFLAGHDEAAFAALVARHLPAVRAVCRSVLRDPNDADDAAQATFLVLVRRADAVRDRQALGAWLCRVAWRTANRLRGENTRRSSRKEAIDPDQTPARTPPTSDTEAATILNDEIGQLPERYRVAVLACYAAGTPTAEAAARLGWPKGTLLTRLAWARRRLRDRLTKRGVTLAGGFTAVFAGQAGTVGGALLAGRICGAAVAVAVGDPAVKQLVSERVSSLTEGVVRAMIGTKIKLVVGAGFLAVTLLGLGLGRMTAGPADAVGKKLIPGNTPAAKAAEPRDAAPARPERGDPPLVQPERVDPPLAAAGPGNDLIVRRPHGSFTREVPAYGKATITFTENRIHVVANVRIEKATFTVTADADYTLNRESMVYGIITGVDVSGPLEGDDLAEIALIAGTASDMPFAFRIRVEDDAIAIKDIKFGPFGSPPLLAVLLGKDGNGAAAETQMIAAMVGGKYKADPNPDRNPPLIPQPAAAPPRSRKK